MIVSTPRGVAGAGNVWKFVKRQGIEKVRAAIVADEYEKDGNLTGFETLSEDDYFDDSIDA